MKFEYTEKGLLKKLTNQFDQTKELQYNIYGQPTLIKEFDGVITRIYYDKEKQVPKKIRDAQDNTTLLYHNENNELIKTISSNGAETEYEYNQQGELMSIINPLKGKTTLEYDAQTQRFLNLDPIGFKQSTPELDELENLATINHHDYMQGLNNYLDKHPPWSINNSYHYSEREKQLYRRKLSANVQQVIASRIYKRQRLGEKCELKKPCQSYARAVGISRGATIGAMGGSVEGGIDVGMNTKDIKDKGAIQALKDTFSSKSKDLLDVEASITAVDGTKPYTTVYQGSYKNEGKTFLFWTYSELYVEGEGLVGSAYDWNVGKPGLGGHTNQGQGYTNCVEISKNGIDWKQKIEIIDNQEVWVCDAPSLYDYNDKYPTVSGIKIIIEAVKKNALAFEDEKNKEEN